jgi:hypothetical protein
MIELLETMPVGELCPKILEDDQGFRVIRLVTKEDRRFVIEAVSVAKRPFGSWLAQQRAGFDIAIEDPELAAAIRIKYPGLW